MIFRKTPSLVGLDIGSSALKAGEIMLTQKGLELKKFGIISIVNDTITKGNINSPENIADLIRQLFKANNIKEKNVAISIGGYAVIVKKIALRTSTEEKLQETIYMAAEQYIPFDLSEVNIDYQVLGETKVGSNQMSILLVAAKKEMINEYINIVQMAGLNPCIIDVDIFALQNIVEVNYNLKNETLAIIDIGATKTSLNIIKGYSSLLMRDVAMGCSHINQKIMSLIDCSFIESEQLKLDQQTDKIAPNELKQIVASVASEWSVEIRCALEFYYSTHPDAQITKIMLSGGGAHIKEFCQLLAAETSYEIEIINPFKMLNINESFDNSYLEQIAPQASICMGLALRRVDDK